MLSAIIKLVVSVLVVGFIPAVNNGAFSSILRNEAYGNGWNAVRSVALERDDYACVVCGATKAELDRNPDVHHIVPVRAFVESDDHEKADAHFLENVVSLCISCHRKAEFGKISAETLRSAIAAESRSIEISARTDG